MLDHQYVICSVNNHRLRVFLLALVTQIPEKTVLKWKGVTVEEPAIEPIELSESDDDTGNLTGWSLMSVQPKVTSRLRGSKHKVSDFTSGSEEDVADENGKLNLTYLCFL